MKNYYKVLILIIPIMLFLAIYLLHTSYSAKTLPVGTAVCINYNSGWGGYIIYTFEDGNKINYTYGRGYISDNILKEDTIEVFSSGSKYVSNREQKIITEYLAQTKTVRKRDVLVDSGFEAILLNDDGQKETKIVISSNNKSFYTSDSGRPLALLVAELMEQCKPKKLSGALLSLRKWFCKH